MKEPVSGKKARLERDEGGLCLTDGELVLRADFREMLPRLQPGRLRGELLVKAARLKDAGEHPLAVDAAAGLGEDAMLLASAGFSVLLYESDPVIAALLRDALLRAGAIPELREAAGRMTLFEEDSIKALPQLSVRPQLVYLDPMFPARKKSGLVKKKLQLLQTLEPPCADEEALLRAAIAAGPERIVIKRPAKGPYLGGRAPTFSMMGKAIRYDCLVFP